MISATLAASRPVPLRQDASIIGLVGLAHASSHFSHLLLPLMFPVFMKEFGLSYSELGLLMTTFFVVSGLGQASGGFLVDRMGARPVLFGALATIATACVVASFANSYAMLVLVAMLAGFGNSPFHPVDFTIMNQRVSSARLGYAFSAHGLTGNLGWAAAPLFFATLGSLYGWRFAYLAAAALYLGILALVVVHRDKLSTTVAVRHAQQGGEPRQLPQRLAMDIEQQFAVPQVGLRLWGVAAEYADQPYAQGVSDDLKSFATSLTEPFCGLNTGFESVNWLQAPAAITSLALIPLRTGPSGSSTPAFGLLVLASGDAQRFTSGMGTDFLALIGELASAALSRLR